MSMLGNNFTAWRRVDSAVITLGALNPTTGFKNDIELVVVVVVLVLVLSASVSVFASWFLRL